MAYLDNSTVTVDAILTKKGREILARSGQLNITRFALADDEVDYDLYNPTHTLGSSYYGAVIENMPILEAVPDESQMMRYKLITLPKGTQNIPIIQISPGGTQTLTSVGQSVILNPTTVNGATQNVALGYTATISDITVADIEVAVAAPSAAAQATTPSFIGEGSLPQSKTVTGISFRVTAKQNSTNVNKATIVTIFGNETGGFETVSIVVVPTVLETLQVVNVQQGGINPGSGFQTV
jgi:hypothetical protein